MRDRKLDEVRNRYHFACGYCGATETATGGLLTLDHYKPRSLGGEDSEDNLVYACFKCNQYKGRFWPDADQSSRQQRVLHPLLDDLGKHLIENVQTGILEALSDTGRFHIGLLRLNRSQLIKNRLNKMMLQIYAQKLRLLEQQILELRSTLEAQEYYISILEDPLDN